MMEARRGRQQQIVGRVHDGVVHVDRQHDGPASHVHRRLCVQQQVPAPIAGNLWGTQIDVHLDAVPLIKEVFRLAVVRPLARPDCDVGFAGDRQRPAVKLNIAFARLVLQARANLVADGQQEGFFAHSIHSTSGIESKYPRRSVRLPLASSTVISRSQNTFPSDSSAFLMSSVAMAYFNGKPHIAMLSSFAFLIKSIMLLIRRTPHAASRERTHEPRRARPRRRYRPTRLAATSTVPATGGVCHHGGTPRT